jgi:hypothetical protein
MVFGKGITGQTDRETDRQTDNRQAYRHTETYSSWCPRKQNIKFVVGVCVSILID